MMNAILYPLAYITSIARCYYRHRELVIIQREAVASRAWRASFSQTFVLLVLIALTEVNSGVRVRTYLR